jgi:hypothetical protein
MAMESPGTQADSHPSSRLTTSNEPTSSTSTLLSESFYSRSLDGLSDTREIFCSRTSATHISPTRSLMSPTERCLLQWGL